jgi:amino acid transporter
VLPQFAQGVVNTLRGAQKTKGEVKYILEALVRTGLSSGRFIYLAPGDPTTLALSSLCYNMLWWMNFINIVNCRCLIPRVSNPVSNLQNDFDFLTWMGAILGIPFVANTMGGLSGMALYSTLLARVAERRLLPLGALGHALARSSSRGVPHFSVLFFAATTLGLQYLDFTYIVAADTMLNLAGFSVIAVAYLRLRVLEPDLARPFRVPGGELGARIVGCACLVFAAAMSVIIAIGEWYAVAAALVSAALIYVAAGFAEEADDKRDDAPSAEEDDRLPLIDE